MQKRNIIKNLMFLFGVIIMGIVGYILGMNRQNVAEEQNINSAENIVEQNITRDESLEIAVVNLDDGTEINGEKIYYAEKMIQFPDTSFRYTSLTEAEAGFNNGLYGAYIIIPADFSENVVSLNSIPQTSEVNYTINSSLTGKNQYTLLYNVMSFGEILNNNLSYMYLDNILTEFHIAQDDANTVMENDIKDKEAIDAIRETDIVSMIEMPELVQTNSDIEALNIDTYVTSNELIADDIDSHYLAYVQAAEEELANLDGSGKNLSDLLNILSTEVSEIDVLRNADGTLIKESAESELDTILGQVSTNESTTITWIKSALEIVKGNVDYTIRILTEELEQLDSDQELKLGEMLEIYSGEMADVFPEMQLVKKEDGSYILTFSTNDVEGVSKDEIENEQSFSEIPALKIYIKDTDDAMTTARQQLLFIIMQKMSEEQKITNQEFEDINSIETDSSLTLNEFLCACDSDDEVKEYLDILGMNSVSEFIDSVENLTSSQISTQKELIIEGDIDSFRDYAMEEIKNISIKYSPAVDVPNTMEALNTLKNQCIEMRAEIDNFTFIDTDSIKDCFTQNYIEPIEKNVQLINDSYTARYTEELDLINAYSVQLNAFVPEYDNTFIADNIILMKNNNEQMIGEVYDNNALYAEYANQVYMDTAQNINTLEESIIAADEESAETLASGLSTAKTIKEGTSSENQELLLAFTELLPYTRLGSVEYTQAYKFIANPAELNANTVDVTINDTASQDETKNETNVVISRTSEKSYKAGKIIALIVAGLILLAAIMGFIIKRLNKDKQAWD